MIENYEERISALEKVAEGALAEIRDLKAEIAESNKENATKPLQFCDGETAWYVDAWGEVDHINDPIEFADMAKNNRLFKSFEMAEEFRQKSQLIADALYWKQLFDADYVPDWGNPNEKKYFVGWRAVDAKFCVSWTLAYKPLDVMFSTGEIAKSFAEWLNARQQK